MRILLASTDEAHASLVRNVLRRFQHEWTTVDNGLDAFQAMIRVRFDLVLLEFDLPRMTAPEVLRRFHTLKPTEMPPAIVLTASEQERERVEAANLPRIEVAARPISTRAFVDRVERVLDQRIRVTCVGGGTGLFTLLSGLKTIPGLSLTSIVGMSDDGGSTGRLRDRFGILPPGDVRRSLVALSTAPDLLNELMEYRFRGGEEFEGHSMGNLILTALAEMRGSMSSAVQAVGEILNLDGEVIPVTESANTLKAELENGTVLTGESRIDLFVSDGPGARVKKLWCDPPALASTEALQALLESDLVLLGPGDLYTSIVSNLIVAGIPDAITQSRAKKAYVLNVMTEPGETCGFSAADHVRQIVRYLGEDCLDLVLCSETGLEPDALAHYAERGQYPVVDDPSNPLSGVTRADIICADLASETELLRHDSMKLATVLRPLIGERA